MRLLCATAVFKWIYGHKSQVVFKVSILVDITVELRRKLSKSLHCAIFLKYRGQRAFIARVFICCSTGAQESLSFMVLF